LIPSDGRWGEEHASREYLLPPPGFEQCRRPYANFVGTKPKSSTQKDVGMFRLFSLLPAIVALSLWGVGSAGPTNASPSNGPASEQCSWVVNPPRVVQVSTTRMVLATVKPGPCAMDAIPNGSVVCLSVQGGDTQGQCGKKVDADPASVYYPYRPGATYILTGQGCVDVFESSNVQRTGPTSNVCQAIGPMSFTL
jgi:hypothetical protein